MKDRATPAVCDPKALDGIFAPFDQCRLPGVAVGITVEGRPVYRRGFGLANMELPVLLTPATRMRIGSTTKHFAALAFLLLCEEGRASIEEKVGHYLPELHPVNRDVTMRALMSHTSGLRDVFQSSMFMHGIGRTITDAQLLDYYKTIDDVEFPAGHGWSYNNGGYLLLTAVIERITGQPLDTVLEQKIFAPIGMYETQLRRWDSDFQSNSAALHMLDPRRGYTKAQMGMELTGAGGIASTVDDMLRWLRHMDSPVVGCADSWREMRSARQLANGVFTSYGFGLISDRYRGIETLSHSGGVIGGNSQMIKVPSAALDIFIAVNRADANSIDLAYRVIDACVPDLEPAEEGHLDPEVCGVYRSPSSGRVIELVALEGQPLMRVDGGMPMGLRPGAPGAWQLAPMFSFLGQMVRADGKTLQFSEFGAEDELDRMQPADATSLDRNQGRYRCGALAVDAQILDEGGEGRLITTGRFGEARYALMPLSAQVWQAKALNPLSPMGGVLTFAPGTESFTLTADRMRNVQFSRTE